MGDKAQVLKVPEAVERLTWYVTELAMLYAECLQSCEVLKAASRQLRLVLDCLSTVDGQRHCPSAGYHREVGLIVLRVDRP